MQLMRRHDPQAQEDGFAMLRPHARQHLPELIAEFEHEQDHGLRCWLLELIGSARDDRAQALLAEQLNNPDQALRSRATTGLQQLGTRQARQLLYQARANRTID
jgi:hypothetical protein